eukprot:TRINITY_DN16582_c0_g1_i1.p1 TRINITY_DN16582_c0_g1~~TRINITY_DN16582_c0_g1_i1.p1  ORF type:complete len:672 (+),score=170.15 TRINITY_DN16582_c0_g1_i1:82-2097(+)
MALMDCIGCRAKVSKEDAFCVWQCRKGHVFACCKADCTRVFDKSCKKVADTCRKLQQKLNNDGQATFLRRVQPAEREKMKQYLEAEKSGAMICPKDCNIGTVPHCLYTLSYSKKPPAVDAKDAEAPLPPQRGSATPKSAPSAPPPSMSPVAAEILDDESLVLINKPSDASAGDGEVKNTGKSKKAQKAEKNKKGQKLLLDFKTPGAAESAAPAPAARLGGGGAWGTAPTAAAVVSPVAKGALRTGFGAGPSLISEAERTSRVETLVATTGCSALQAETLLERQGWNLNSAAELYYRENQESPREDPQPRWGLRVDRPAARSDVTEPSPAVAASRARPQAQQQRGAAATATAASSAASSAPAAAASTAVASTVVQPEATPLERMPPPRPPPPPLPVDWQAVWNEEENAYYFWHKPTNYTTWDAPQVNIEPEASRLRSRQEEERELVEALQQRLSLQADASRALLTQSDWDLEAAIAARLRQLEAERLEEHRRAEDLRRRQEEEREAHERAAATAAFAASRAKLGPRIVVRHWQPRADVAHTCLRLMQGERVEVTWAAESAEGWAYGRAASSPGKDGYFPQAVLAPIDWQPRQRQLGEKLRVRETFIAPEEVAGYLSVTRGDIVRVLHPLDEPFVWAYVGRLCKDTDQTPENGWVPESVLEREGDSLLPQRAG